MNTSVEAEPFTSRRLYFLTYFGENDTLHPTGGEVYNSRILAGLACSPACKLSVVALANIPFPFRSKWLSNLYFLYFFLLKPMDTIIVDAGFLGRCAFALPVLRLRRIPLALIVHHFDYQHKRNPIVRIYDFLGSFVGLLCANRAVVNSQFTLEQMKTLFGYGKPALLIPPALSFEPGNLQKKDHERIGERPVRCLCVGSIEPRKNLEVLVELANRAPKEARFVISIAGKEDLHPKYAETLRRMLRESSRVEFLGYVDNRSLLELYRQADVFLFPSKWEGYGMAVAEALACGVPVVAFNASAMPYLVKDGVNGILIPAYETERFVSEAVELILNREKVTELSKNCRLRDEYMEGWEAKAARVTAFLTKQ